MEGPEVHDQAHSLEEAKTALVRCWGEMAPYWGISRTMAEVHALLFLCPEPLCTDQIMAELAISRGNASMTVRSLLDWGLVHRVHRKGDRKDYYVCDASVWTIFENIARQRKRREVEPIFDTISHCRDLARDAEQAAEDPEIREMAHRYHTRLEEMREFLQVFSHLFESFLQAGPTGLREMAAMLAAAQGLQPPGGDQSTTSSP